MRSVLAASPLSLGAPVHRLESGASCDGEPEQRPLERFTFLVGAPVETGLSGVTVLQGSPYPQPVDKLGNFT
jgi:hypothetical protein